jgi:starch synthase
VSPTHAEEIQTPELGMGLDALLRARSGRLVGILNGVDYDEWNPTTDPLIPFNYSADDLAGKEHNKRALLQDLSLPYDPQAPVLGVVSRLVDQKGIDLLVGAMPGLLEQLDLRLVVLGTGEPEFESQFRSLHLRFPRKVSFYRGYSNDLAHRIEAGSDLFLMPSRYEPCGLNQMYSLRYGTVPVVRATGGLADTVQAWSPETGTGTGFLFEEYSDEALTEALHRALNTFRDQPAWHQLVLNGMGQDFSWTKQAQEYEALYRLLLRRGEGPSPPN